MATGVSGDTANTHLIQHTCVNRVSLDVACEVVYPPAPPFSCCAQRTYCAPIPSSLTSFHSSSQKPHHPQISV